MIRKYFKNLIDKKYPNWDTTIALRYLPIVDSIKKSYKETDTILEVGSEITGITTYFQKTVTGVDVDFDLSKKNKYLKPVKGSATDLPFENKSFDFVLSVDMLEHIQPKMRTKAIMEMMRVTRKKMYLAFPMGKTSEQIDQELHKYFLEKRGQEYPYLLEHVTLGLPDYREVKKVLDSSDEFQIREYNNTNIKLWKLLLKWGLSGERLKSSLYRRALLLMPLLKHMNFGTTYRKLFILERKNV